MNIEFFKYFLQVVDNKSISKASIQAHITQSALSQIIQKIESDLGYELLSRSNKGVELTKYGEIVYEYVDIILKTYDRMKNELYCVENNCANVVIKGSWSIANYSLPCILFEIKKMYPLIHFDVISSNSSHIIDDVQNGICDFGIIFGKPDKISGMNCHYIGQEKIVLVAGYNYEISERITIEELRNYSIIDFTLGSYTQEVNRLVNEYLKSKKLENIELKSFFSIDSISAVKSSIENNFGLSFLPYMSIKKELYEKKFKIITLENLSLTLNMFLISQLDEKINKQTQDIINAFLNLGSKAFC